MTIQSVSLAAIQPPQANPRSRFDAASCRATRLTDPLGAMRN